MTLVAKRVVAVLTPDLLRPAYRGGGHPLAGHCYVAAEACYHLLGGKAGGWMPQNIRHDGVSHWYLKHADGCILDPTAAQFSRPPRYARGRGRGFLTRAPSARAAEVIERVRLKYGK